MKIHRVVLLYLKFCMSGVKLFERNLANHRPSSRLTLVGKILVRFVLRIFPDYKGITYIL